MRFKHIDYCLILFNKPNSLQVFSNSFISQYDRMFSSKPHSMQARADQTPAKPHKKKSPQNMTPCITIKRFINLEGASDSECETQDLKPLVVFTVRYRSMQIVNLVFFKCDLQMLEHLLHLLAIRGCSSYTGPIYSQTGDPISHIILHFLLFFSDKTMMFLG